MHASLLNELRVAIVHYWLLGYAGGERVVSALLQVFPQADLFTLLADQRTQEEYAPARFRGQIRTVLENGAC